MSKLYRIDKEINAMYIKCNDVKYLKSVELKPFVILDFGIDENNEIKVKGIEILECENIIEEIEEFFEDDGKDLNIIN